MVRGSNPSGSEIFHTLPDGPWGPPSLLYNAYRIFSRSKASETRRRPPTASYAEVKERVELYLYSPSKFSWLVCVSLTVFSVTWLDSYSCWSPLPVRSTPLQCCRTAVLTRTKISYRPSVHPSMALQSLPGLGLPHKTPPFISIRSSSPPPSCPQQL
jgi:hypothetical protein